MAAVNGSLQPIIPGFHPDPSICRVGDDYYLANSSFEYFPGVPIWHSTDLVRWTLLGHALTRRTQFRTGFSWPSLGIYGLTLRFHDGRFWMITTNFSDFRSGQVLVSATDPAGEWSEPVFVPGAPGLDPDLCWDGDDCYLTWRSMDPTLGYGILQARLDVETGTLGPIYPIWQGSGLHAPEGPHLYRVGEYWYLILAEGGTERGHAVTAARAPHPSGPWEACPGNPIFTHRSLGHPVQSTGHADLVQTPEGEWAAVYLGTRPRGYVPGFHVLGRETFLAGVRWIEGWPVIEEERYEVPIPDTAFVDDFASAGFHPRWVTPYSEPEAVARPHRSSGLVLPAVDGPVGLLCTRVRDHHWASEATVESAGRFCVRIDDRHWYGLRLEDGVVRAEVRIGDLYHEVGSQRVSEQPVVLRIESVSILTDTVPQGHGGPDDIVLSVTDEHGRRDLARIDGRYLSTEVATGFTGRMLALGSCATESRVHSVSYTPCEPGEAAQETG